MSRTKSQKQIRIDRAVETTIRNCYVYGSSVTSGSRVVGMEKLNTLLDSANRTPGFSTLTARLTTVPRGWQVWLGVYCNEDKEHLVDSRHYTVTNANLAIINLKINEFVNDAISEYEEDAMDGIIPVNFGWCAFPDHYIDLDAMEEKLIKYFMHYSVWCNEHRTNRYTHDKLEQLLIQRPVESGANGHNLHAPIGSSPINAGAASVASAAGC